MSGLGLLLLNRSEGGLIAATAAADNGTTFPRLPSLVGPPTSVSAAAAGASGGGAAAEAPRRPGGGGDVYVYVWVFLSLLALLLTLLVVSLHRLKNIITSSSAAAPDRSSSSSGSERTSAFTNMEICSITSQKSAVSTLSN